jgi:hypothetical protein
VNTNINQQAAPVVARKVTTVELPWGGALLFEGGGAVRLYVTDARLQEDP